VTASVAATTATDMRVASAATATAAAMTATAAAANKFYVRRSCVLAFLVEDVERCQANVCDFFLTEEDLIAISVA
jgi:hypothetical protein